MDVRVGHPRKDFAPVGLGVETCSAIVLPPLVSVVGVGSRRGQPLVGRLGSVAHLLPEKMKSRRLDVNHLKMSTYSETQVRKALREWQVDCEEGVIETLRASASTPGDDVYTILTNTGLKGFPNAIIGPTRKIKDALMGVKNSLGGVVYVSNVISLTGGKKEYGPGWKFSEQAMGAIKEILEGKTFREVDVSGSTKEPPPVNDNGNYEIEGYVFYPVNCPEGKVFYVVGVQDQDSEELYLESVVPLTKKGVVECQQKGWMVMGKKALDLVRSAKYKPRLVELYEGRT